MLLVATVSIGFAALAVAWALWLLQDRKLQFPRWRRTIAHLGFLAVTAQATTFLEFWRGVGNNDVLFARWARWVLLSFLVALPCSVAGRGPSRVSLLLASILLFTICFFMVLSA